MRYQQELGGERAGGLEQRLRVVATEQLDLPIPASTRASATAEEEDRTRSGRERGGSRAVTWWLRRGRGGRGRRRGWRRPPGRRSGRLAAGSRPLPAGC
jgi:hypothetical protein